MVGKTRGIVFNAIKFTESSLIVRIYTRAFGLQSCIMKGVRKPGVKNKASFFQPLRILDLEIFRRENQNLQYLKDFGMAYIFRNLPFDAVKSSMGMFMLEILNSVIREEECNHSMYDFLEHEIISLDTSHPTDRNCHLRFLLGMSRHLGFYPSDTFAANHPFFDLKEGHFVPAAPRHRFYLDAPLSHLLRELIAGENPVDISPDQRNALLEKLLTYYRLHISEFRNIKSHKILHEVLSA